MKHCCNFVTDLITGIIPIEPPAPVERMLYTTDFSAELDGDVETINLGTYGSVFVFQIEPLANYLQTNINADCGVSFYGIGYSFWVSFPSSEIPPNDWYYTVASDPGTQIPITLSEAGLYTTYTCMTRTIAPGDLSQWYPYYLSSSIAGNNEIGQAVYTDPGVSAIFSAAVSQMLGANATGTLDSPDGINETVSIFHIPDVAGHTVNIVSWDFINPQDNMQLIPVACP